MLKGLKALQEEKFARRHVCVCLEKVPRKIDGIEILPFKRFLQALWQGNLFRAVSIDLKSRPRARLCRTSTFTLTEFNKFQPPKLTDCHLSETVERGDAREPETKPQFVLLILQPGFPQLQQAGDR